EQVDAPLPVVEADRARDDLGHGAGVAAPDDAVVAHHLCALVEGHGVPVLRLPAALVHGIEADVAPRWDLGEEPADDTPALLLHLGVEGLLELRRPGLEPL